MLMSKCQWNERKWRTQKKKTQIEKKKKQPPVVCNFIEQEAQA